MKSVCPNDEIEITHDPGFEPDVNSFFDLFNLSNAVAENRFYLALDRVVDGRGKV